MRERFKPLDRVNLLNLPTLSLSHSGCSADDLPFLALSLWRRARTRALAASLADTGPSRPNPYPAEWWPKIWGLAPLFADPVLPASCQCPRRCDLHDGAVPTTYVSLVPFHTDMV
ncbi:hypothetical protein BS78_03G245800 [Paspalum vaginatum]|nr:hypothetical protein BS78_03G245800 [Paspalum vaginatum]KAJ1284975.1 hypothetical protein BS78_03G245800 [Paspalum vaginatum]